MVTDATSVGGKWRETAARSSAMQRGLGFAALGLLLFLHAPTALAGFDWGTGQCSGNGRFNQYIQGDAVVDVGEIPAGRGGITIRLSTSSFSEDVDIQLYDRQSGQAIVAWPDGMLSGPDRQETNYLGVAIEWSGYNGDGTGLGNEYIKISNLTTRPLVMKAYGYRSGTATVEYSWTTTSGCGGPAERGSGTFQQQILRGAVVDVGELVPGLENVFIRLRTPSWSDDVDVQLHDPATGRAIVSWPDGLLAGAGRQAVQYAGLTIEWSGYNGDGSGLGNEYIRITGKLTGRLVMKAYGYTTGFAEVAYSWGAIRATAENWLAPDPEWVFTVGAGATTGAMTKTQGCCSSGDHDGDDRFAEDWDKIGVGWQDIPLRAPYAGVVVYTRMNLPNVYNATTPCWQLKDANGTDYCYGNQVIIDHGRGIYSRFAHLNDVTVAVGQAVLPKDVLGHVGNSGFSSAQHLHVVFYKGIGAAERARLDVGNYVSKIKNNGPTAYAVNFKWRSTQP